MLVYEKNGYKIYCQESSHLKPAFMLMSPKNESLTGYMSAESDTDSRVAWYMVFNALRREIHLNKGV
jgi:hypothetical protein